MLFYTDISSLYHNSDHEIVCYLPVIAAALLYFFDCAQMHFRLCKKSFSIRERDAGADAYRRNTPRFLIPIFDMISPYLAFRSACVCVCDRVGNEGERERRSFEKRNASKEHPLMKEKNERIHALTLHYHPRLAPALHRSPFHGE